MELYHNNMSVCAQKVRLVLAEKRLEPIQHHMMLRNGDTHKPEYLHLNPNGVVPTLVDQGHSIVESTVICEYLDEAYPDPPLKPANAIDRAQMRLWTLLPDASLHGACGLISVGIAWRHQIQAAGGAQTRGVERKLSLKPLLDVIELGLESSYIAGALQIYDETVARMANRLAHSDWLAGQSYSLADASMLPYVLRLQHLGMEWLWDDARRGGIESWLERSRARPNYCGVADYLDEGYLQLARQKGEEAEERLKAMVREVRT